MTAPLVYLLAGEVSGDRLGGRLMAALRERTGGALRFAGVGGAAMAAEGLNSLFPMKEVSLMGIAEILPHLPNLLRRLKQTEADVRALRPSALVTIDAPAFTLRVSERVADLGVPRIHYVAPQVWAWRPGRAKRLARKTDRLLTLLPFEPPYFTRYGLPADYTGHPVLEGGAGRGDGAGFRRRHGIPREVPLLVVLLGSRGGEVRRLADVFGQAVGRLVARRPNLRLVLPTVEPVSIEVRAAVADWPGQPLIVEDELEKFDAFAAGTAALAASGTVALELALAGLPMVIAYRLNWLTWQLARSLVKVPYASMVNLILERACVPEYLQEACSPVEIALALEELLMPNSDAGHKQKEGFAHLREKLSLGSHDPSERAAEIILAALRF